MMCPEEWDHVICCDDALVHHCIKRGEHVDHVCVCGALAISTTSIRVLDDEEGA